ncbi:MAG: right-handed parallel beta-helix repeat-containing protein [Kiritimatiellae bacterium]|nr:right-handed parallel beta-helix repeat-containing protein [Kiritimatiellia bacterium]
MMRWVDHAACSTAPRRRVVAALVAAVALAAAGSQVPEMHLSSFSPHADGVQDDTAALRDLFKAAAKAKCRKVVIDPGVYLFEGSSPIPLYGGCIVVAEGAEFRFPRKLGGRHLTMFRGTDITGFSWRGGFFRGYVYDPARKDNDWEPHASSRGIVLDTTAKGRTADIRVSDIGGDGLCGAAVTVIGYIGKGVTNRAENIDVRDCSLSRCGKFMWDYGFLWERRAHPELFDADQVALANRYDDLSAPLSKSYWQWGPRGSGPGKGGIDVCFAANVIVSGCRMNACGDAMHISGCHHVTFSANQITGARMGAFFIAHFCKDVTVTGNTVDGTNGSRVMSVEASTEDITIIGNTFRNGGRGSWINQPKNIIIANNIFCSNTLKCTPEIGKGRLTYHKGGGFERYPEIYFTTYQKGATYGPVVMTGNIFTLSPHASLAVAFRNGGRGIVFENNIYRGATKDAYIGPHCEVLRMSGNVGLGKVVREIGDAQSGGGVPEDQWQVR